MACSVLRRNSSRWAALSWEKNSRSACPMMVATRRLRRSVISRIIWSATTGLLPCRDRPGAEHALAHQHLLQLGERMLAGAVDALRGLLGALLLRHVPFL